MLIENHIVNHSRFGKYEQRVYDSIFEAGHKQLASEGKYGWGMPLDPATQEFVNSTDGKIVFEIGSGLGDVVVLPALAKGARQVFATDISPQHLSQDSIMIQEARRIEKLDQLRVCLIDEQWWEKDLLTNPTTKEILGVRDSDNLPEDETVDLMMARHVVQFGDPNKFLRFLDLAAVVLKDRGSVTGINFTPYTNYFYKYDQGKTMREVYQLNGQFANGEIATPGGFIHPYKGILRLSLAQLMGKPELDRGNNNSFLYFDHNTTTGLLRLWQQSREKRNLPSNLQLVEIYYFSPPSIAQVNKLTDSPEFENMENHVFIIQKVN